MDSNNIEQLLEKYWMCETSLEEEQQLRDFFKGHGVPASLKEATMLFRFFDAEKNNILQENFESAVTKQLRQRQGGKVISMVRLNNIARIAAGILVVVVATSLFPDE